MILNLFFHKSFTFFDKNQKFKTSVKYQRTSTRKGLVVFCIAYVINHFGVFGDFEEIVSRLRRYVMCGVEFHKIILSVLQGNGRHAPISVGTCIKFVRIYKKKKAFNIPI